MDDVWCSEAWDQLKMSLPDINNGRRVTYRMKNVVVHHIFCYPREMEFLDDDKSCNGCTKSCLLG